MLNKPEILAPAGTVESVRAAVNAGADAVYVGGNMFSARAFAGNFDTNELLDTIDYCHIHNVKLYMAVNTLLKNNELSMLTDYMEPFVKQGVDGVIIQDMGVFRILKKAFPELPLHGSTQMSITSSYGAEFLRNLGFTRFVPARELSLNEIKQIKAKTDMEIETFVHGAMCYCYSGKCLMSSYAGGRSGNRGRCAQPCRKLYTGNGYKEYALSLKDMCMLGDLDKLIDAGIDSFKIEGRMKRPEYVAAATYAYKEVRDAYLCGEDIGSIADKYNNMLLDIYNRGGFSKGYYFMKNGKELLANKRPNHQGIMIGTVVSVNKPNITIQLDCNVNAQDIVEIRTQAKDIELTTGTSAGKGELLELKAKDFHLIKKGDKVYRTRNNALLEKINKELVNNAKKITVDAHITAKIGKRLRLDITNPYNGNIVAVESDIVSAANNRPVTKEQLLEKLSKTGGTEFVFHLTGDIDDGIFVQLGSINALRRDGIVKIRKDIVNAYRRKLTNDDIDNDKINTDNHKNDITKNTEAISDISKNTEAVKNRKHISYLTGVTCYVKNAEQFRIVNNFEFVESIIVEYNAYRATIQKALGKTEHEKAAAFQPAFDKTADIYIALPYVMRESNISLMEEIYATTAKCKGYLVKNIDQLAFLADKKYKGRIIFDSILYAYNNEAVSFYKALFDETAFVVSNELRLDEMKGLYYTPVIKLYGHQAVMYTANCMTGYYHGCNNEKKNICSSFKDDLNNRFYAVNDCSSCGSVIYNGLPTDISDYYAENIKNIPCCLLDFTVEDAKQTENVMNEFSTVIKGNTDALLSQGKARTKGHYFRGID